jgi:hypothetical protein
VWSVAEKRAVATTYDVRFSSTASSHPITVRFEAALEFDALIRA